MDADARKDAVAGYPGRMPRASLTWHRARAGRRHRARTGRPGCFRQVRPLPAGAVVVKEKYDDASASGPLRGYGVMIKRAAGYDRRGGDWEYGYVTLAPTPVVARGRLAGCAGCHASARDSDYLFRRHVNTGHEARGR